MTNPSVAVLIPARRASTRLAEKLLLAEHGEPLIATAARQAAKAYGPNSVIVCADDQVLVDAALRAGVAARLTRTDHESGTDRIAEVAATLDAEIIVNVQGDEPEMEPAHILLVAGLLQQHHWADMATLAVPGDAVEQRNANNVKVVLGTAGFPSGQGRCLYFTRAPAVWDREARTPRATCLRHLGIYAYRRDLLLGYRELPASPLEQCERLEQLRALEAGVGIACAVVDHAPAGIDIREDYDAFLARRR
jgi:3-deoxy-manno-octulosonate cytidylyltransferase (CMP-KDO synthetase)